MPGVWLNVAQEVPGSDGEFIVTPSFEQFPLVVLSTTPLMEAVEDLHGKDERAD